MIDLLHQFDKLQICDARINIFYRCYYYYHIINIIHYVNAFIHEGTLSYDLI